jgi:tRNA-Thr(GGU) m(6)t(6)A37 methyltransferase TsaA
MPIQPPGAAGVNGTIHIRDEFVAGLRDLDGFSHLILLYVFHQSKGYNLEVTPFMDTTIRGLFATRAPKRPNPIGLSIVQLDRIDSGVLHISNVDILDGTPLIDIKPYVPNFDQQKDVRIGWLAKNESEVAHKISDDRFK